MGTSAATVSQATVLSKIDVTENVQDAPGASGKTITNTAMNPSQSQYNATSTPPATNYSADNWTLTGGAATIDLTDLPGLQANIDAVGKKVRVLRIQGAVGNGALTISPGAVNGYELFGSGNDLVYPAGNTKPFQMEFDDAAPDITDVSGSGESQIDLSGTADDVFEIEILVG